MYECGGLQAAAQRDLPQRMVSSELLGLDGLSGACCRPQLQCMNSFARFAERGSVPGQVARHRLAG